MLNIEIDVKTRKIKVVTEGSTTMMATDFAFAISWVFARLRAGDPAAAEDFRMKLLDYLSPDSPVWSMPPELLGGTMTSIPIIRKDGQIV